MNIIFEPWPWYVAGPLITMVMFLLYYYGRKFGVSSNLETLCTIGGAGTFNSFFKRITILYHLFKTISNKKNH